MSETIHLTVQEQLPVGLTTEQARVINAVSPTAEVERVEGGAVLTVHDLSGTTSAMLYDGAPGAQGPAGPSGQDGQPGRDGVDGSPGAPGQDGADGVSPTITVTDITGGHRVTITDADGTKTVDVMDGADGQPGQAGADGQDGADGFSPTASVSKTGSTATITITDASGTTTAQVSDGANGQDGTDGQDGVGVPAGGTAGQVLAKASGTDYDTEWTTPAPGGVTDVQVNGTSVVSNGVANVPVASSDIFGVIKTNSNAGIDINTSNGKLRISSASGSQVRGGTDAYKPIVPSNQHTAAFYGLAKAAGDTTQSSITFDGQYTDAAKDKIMTMLGIDALIAKHEGATASEVKTAGDVFIYNGKLYKVTASIASGAAIVPGTNCTQTTIIDIVKGA